jgi:1-acyl-sn-glycerol-3-phosphate acyltransferase
LTSRPTETPRGEGSSLPPLATPPGAVSNAVFWLFWAVFGLLVRLLFRLRIEGRPPLRGAFVLAANHTSFLDPLLLGACLRRRVVFLMTAVVWRSVALGWFYRWNKAIPLAASGGNRDALRAARLVLQQGRVVGIFPEGGLSRDGLPMLGNPGAVSLVLNEGVPIVPVGIVGAHDALPPGCALPRLHRVTIRFGAPITAAELDACGGDRRARLQAATDLIMQRIAALTGQPSREAELASLPR